MGLPPAPTTAIAFPAYLTSAKPALLIKQAVIILKVQGKSLQCQHLFPQALAKSWILEAPFDSS